MHWKVQCHKRVKAGTILTMYHQKKEKMKKIGSSHQKAWLRDKHFLHQSTIH